MTETTHTVPTPQASLLAALDLKLKELRERADIFRDLSRSYDADADALARQIQLIKEAVP